MPSVFNELNSVEKGFAEVFETRVKPQLSQLEAERKALLSKATRHAALALGAGLVLALLMLLFGTGSEGLGGILAGLGVPVILGGVAAFLLWKRQEKRWEGSVAEALMPAICDHVGDLSYDRNAHKSFPLDQIRRLGIIRPFTHPTLSDRLEGRYRDTPFEMVEAKLESKKTASHTGGKRADNSNRSTTVFKGLLFRIGVPDPIPTRILIARSFMGPGNKLAEMLSRDTGRTMPKVTTGHARFDEKFVVYSADPDVARRVLAPAFLDNLLEISEAEADTDGTRTLEAAFHEDSFFLALNRKSDFLKMGSLRKPVTGVEEDLHLAFEDIALIHRIIDRLHGDHPDAVEPSARAV